MIKTCVYCDEVFEPVRSTKKYCSDECKYQYHALKDKIVSDGDSGIEMILRLASKVKKYPDKRREVLAQVQRIESTASKLRAKLQ